MQLVPWNEFDSCEGGSWLMACQLY